jgi:hypothetical protein
MKQFLQNNKEEINKEIQQLENKYDFTLPKMTSGQTKRKYLFRTIYQ